MIETSPTSMMIPAVMFSVLQFWNLSFIGIAIASTKLIAESIASKNIVKKNITEKNALALPNKASVSGMTAKARLGQPFTTSVTSTPLF